MSALDEISNILPYVFVKRISKTGEGRSGDDIYKRRNRRSYRVLMQYGTWLSKIQSEEGRETLKKYSEGFIVLIKPADYFGDNYPNPNKKLAKEFVLGKTGIVYYNLIDEYQTYPPLQYWHQVYELSTTGKSENDDTWVGDYCLNIKNTNPKQISKICETGNNSDSTEAKRKIANELKEDYGLDIDPESLPSQRGLGNYDYDYASKEMIDNVKLQMTYMMLTCEDSKGENFCKFILNNYENLKSPKDSSTFTKNIKSSNYKVKYEEFFRSLEDECKQKGLLDKHKLAQKNAWDETLDRPICPLCCKPIKAEDFVKEIEQDEGRRVLDNTQREIVLMHITALHPGAFNHRTYNLGWGHNYCNMVQGSADIDVTIEELQQIINEYLKHVEEASKNND